MVTLSVISVLGKVKILIFFDVDVEQDAQITWGKTILWFKIQIWSQIEVG